METLMVAGAILCELLGHVAIIDGFLKKEKNVSVIYVVLFLIVTTLYLMFVPEQWINGCYLLTFLYIKFGYRLSWKESLVTVILSLLLVAIIELVSYFPFAFLFFERLPDSVTNFSAALICFGICLILAKRVPIRLLLKFCKRTEVWYIVVILVSGFAIVSAIFRYHMTLALELGDYLYISAGVLLMWLLCFRLMKYRYEEKIRKKYFDAFCSVIDQIKRRQHKFQNQLDAIYSLHNLYDEYDTLVEKQRQYLDKLTDYEMPSDLLMIENPILIAHIFDKMSEAQEMGIRVQMKLLCSLGKIGIEDIHMVEILGTLFDNAIQDMKENQKREFLLFEIKEEEKIVIRVANPHVYMKNDEIQRMFEKGYSTKEGENRGIGLYNVKKLIQKYKMDLLVENSPIYEENYISISVMMEKTLHL